MNLFELFVKIGVDDQASGKLSKLSSSLGKGIATAAKIGTAAVGAAAAGITALTTAAVNNYAEYEQLVGGVETLFKDSADKLMGYAETAYRNQGVSANTYMSLATSFSASLLQSLEGDTKAAVEATNLAITDMSDNANKMGTDLSMIQNAYQGFAKANYTMLDNLKLGYGGTKEEMQRLVLDASKLNDAIKSPFEEGALDFDNIVNAIHTIQTEMGITGTTALEAGRTISGSVGSMKAAWTNLVTGFADGSADIGGLIDNLVTTIVGDGTENNLGVIGNVLPAIETALGGIVKLIEGAAPKIIEILPGLIDRVVPSVISAATGMVKAVVDVLPDLLKTIVDALVKEAPELIKAAVELVKSLVTGIKDNYQILVDGAITIVEELVKGVAALWPEIIKLGLDLIVSLANGIATSLPTLIPTIVGVILQIVNTLTSPDMLSKILDAALVLLVELSYGLMDAIPQLVDAVLDIIDNLVVFLLDPENIAKILNAALHIVIALGTGLIDAVPRLLGANATLIKKLVENFKETDWGEVGKNIVDGLLDGLKKAWESLKKWFTNAWDNLVGGIGDFFGGIFGGDTTKLSIDGSHRNGLDYVPYDGYIAELHKGERVLTASEASGYGGTSIGNININIDGAKYTDEQSLASAIALEIQNMTDRRAAVYA